MTTLADSMPLTLGPPVEAGPLRLFPRCSAAPAAPAYLCGPQADEVLDVGEREEGAQVPYLTVAVAGTLPVLLVEGEVLLGSWQNRVLNVSVLCPAAAATEIPVSCVEAGRWGAARKGARSPRHAPSRLRGAKSKAVGESLRAGAGRSSDQGEVWEVVAGYAMAHGVRSATSALEDVAEAVATGGRSRVSCLPWGAASDSDFVGDYEARR